MAATMAKKRGRTAKDRNEDRHKQPRLVFHLPQALYDAFQTHVENLAPRPAESEVLRLALRRYLEAAGDWPPPEGPPSPPAGDGPKS